MATDVDHAPPGGAAFAASVDLDTVVGSVLFLAIFILVWVSLQPFQDLSAPQLEITDSGNVANQIGFASLFLAAAAWMVVHEPARLKPLLRPALVVLLIWFALCVATSWEPALSARRLVFTLIVLALAAMALLVPKNLRHFSDLLAAATLIVLALCYMGVLFLPDLAIHQASDFLEPEHAGSWRGSLPHKNQAGALMVVFIFIGLFVARLRSVVIGAAIVALSGVFLVFSFSKTSIALLPLVLIVSGIARHVRPIIGIVTAVAVLAAINLVSLGSIYFAPVRDALGQIMDPSFTGRTDIWQFALEQLAERPITGFGFSAFWGTERVVYGMSQGSNWAANATDAHNAYLNLALTVGIPGLVLALVWTVVLPIVDFYRRPAEAGDALLATLFLRIWLFGIYAASFETTLFQQVGEVWFILLFSVFGLRYLSLQRVTP